MPNSKHLTHGISNLVSLITKTKLGLSAFTADIVKICKPAQDCRVFLEFLARL
jgi:hypothetical protein